MTEQLTSEGLKAMMRLVIDEVWNKGNRKASDEIFAASVVLHRTTMPELKGSEAWNQYVADLRSAFPDIRFTVEALMAEGNVGVTQWTWRGTHQGLLPNVPIPPTGKQVTMAGCTVYRALDGKFVEMWAYSDYLGMMQQLGVIPPQPPAQ